MRLTCDEEHPHTVTNARNFGNEDIVIECEFAFSRSHSQFNRVRPAAFNFNRDGNTVADSRRKTRFSLTVELDFNIGTLAFKSGIIDA